MGTQARKIPSSKPKDTSVQYQRVVEALLILLSVAGFFLLTALASYNLGDPAWSTTGTNISIHNLNGALGAYLADLFFYFLGIEAYLVPLVTFVTTYYVFKDKKLLQELLQHNRNLLLLKVLGLALFITAGATLLELHFYNYAVSLPVGIGGIFGRSMLSMLLPWCNALGTTILALGLFVTGITLMFGLSWLKIADYLGAKIVRYSKKLYAQLQDLSIEKIRQKFSRKPAPKVVSSMQNLLYQDNRALVSLPVESVCDLDEEEQEEFNTQVAVKTQPVAVKKIDKALHNYQPVFVEHSHDFKLPGISLLDNDVGLEKSVYSEEVLEQMSRLVEAKLSDFGIEAHVVGVRPGPVIIRFELQLAPGTKASKITTLATDLARSLSIVSVRVVEIIPGKPYIGLELPKDKREIVRLAELISSEEYSASQSRLCLALGKDIAGSTVIVDLAKMPHLLVAGTTGSGKSVGINGMLLSLLFKFTPKEVRMIMIDPKMLELSIYDGIPHLLTPVVTDMKDAANALRWCVGEMEYRYQLLAALGVRNITGYNQLLQNAAARNEVIKNPLWDEKQKGEPAPILEPLPYIVVIVDEFADMIMVVGRKVEELIARIAQKARAAGIHMIIATQRPSVDVITGLIKANIPTRIAYQVSSRIDSRTILDQQGAEQLLGQGDMLYLPPGSGMPIRVHGAFVADHEVHKVAAYWKQFSSGEDNDILNTHFKAASVKSLSLDTDTASDDPIYDEVVEYVIETKRASISSVQRRFKIGYNRAARLIEQMEEDGLVSAMQANGSREVLVSNN